NRKSSSQRFHESFFAGPAFEKGLYLVLFRQSAQNSGLLRGKEAFSNFLSAKIRAELLNINTHFQPGCHSQELVFTCMRKIEFEAAGVDLRFQVRFLLRAINKLHL